jgi:hypothetical protein
LTSDHQWRTNQANAKASTGPKTKAGKARSARNALRHGLSIPVCKEPSLSVQAEEIALKLAGPDPDETLLDRARAIGEAQVDLNRVRARRNALVAQLLADPKYQPRSAYKSRLRRMRSIDRVQRILGTSFDFDDIEPLVELKPLKDDEKFATVLEDRFRELAALDRYERRAISKRKFAIRAFDSACMSPRGAGGFDALAAAGVAACLEDEITDGVMTSAADLKISRI